MIPKATAIELTQDERRVLEGFVRSTKAEYRLPAPGGRCPHHGFDTFLETDRNQALINVVNFGFG